MYSDLDGDNLATFPYEAAVTPIRLNQTDECRPTALVAHNGTLYLTIDAPYQALYVVNQDGSGIKMIRSKVSNVSQLKIYLRNHLVGGK